MSQWLANIFEKQASKRSGEDEGRDHLVPALMIEFQGLRYVSDFSYLSEVIENGPIVPYPERHPAHIGIINMRGSIVPVICLSMILNHEIDAHHCGKLGLRDQIKFPRMVVFNTPAGSFAVGADNVKKCLVALDAMANNREIELDGKVYRILNESFFQRMEEMVA